MRREVGFEVEARYLGDEPAVIHTRQDFLRDRRWPEVGVHQKHLLLRADTADAALHQVAFEHQLRRAQVIEERLHEGPPLMLVQYLFDILLAHS